MSTRDYIATEAQHRAAASAAKTEFLERVAEERRRASVTPASGLPTYEYLQAALGAAMAEREALEVELAESRALLERIKHQVDAALESDQ